MSQRKSRVYTVEVASVPRPAKLCLLERDVTLAVVYGQACIIILRHQPRGTSMPGAEVLVYTMQK